MGEFDKLLGPAEVVNGLNSEGELSGFNQLHATCSGGNGFGAIRGDKWCVVQALGNDGSGFVTACKSPGGGLGDGTKPPTGERGTSNFMAGTAKNRETITRMCNGEGTGISIKTGSGKPTMLLSTGDGQNGILITDGFVALYSKGTELIVHGNAGKVTSTYHLIQETNKGGGKVFVPTNSGSQTLVVTDA